MMNHSYDPPKILIVDDAMENIRALHAALQEIGDIFFATSGYEALSIILSSEPDIVLLDIFMPEIDGYSICKLIKENPLIRDIPVIFITGNDSADAEIEALRSGGIDFLRKPLNLPVIQARVTAHLTLRLQTRRLMQAESDLDTLLSRLPAFVALWDEDLVNLFCNDKEGRWFDKATEAMKGCHLRDVVGEANFQALDRPVNEALNGASPCFDMSFHRDKDLPLVAQVSLVHRPLDKAGSGFLMLLTDISDRKRAEIALHNQKERLRVTLSSIGDAVIATDLDGHVTFMNPIAEDLTGWLEHAATGQTIETIMPLRDGIDGDPLRNPLRWALKEGRVVAMSLNCVLQRQDGRFIHVEDSAAPIIDHEGAVSGGIIVFHDVSEARAMALKMTHLANHDPLTDLPNRLLLRDRGEQSLHVAERTGATVALMSLDVDDFKSVNNLAGHTGGDLAIQEIAKRLTSRLPPTATVSRHGSDEFIILVPDVGGLPQVEALALNLLAAFDENYEIDGKSIGLTASLGSALYPNDSDSMETLYKHADVAMYRAKQSGGGRHCFYSEEIERIVEDRVGLIRRIRKAVQDQAFEVYYQPKIDAAEGRIVGAEALVRWRAEDGTFISPSAFIPAADESGLIIPLGEQVLKRACLDARGWHDGGFPIRVAINVSPVQFARREFIGELEQTLMESGCSANLIELEITEGAFIQDINHTREAIAAVKTLGSMIAIDDFGTGYCSLAYLKRFDIDVLKIDQSFIRDMLCDHCDAAIVTAITDMARALKLRLVAEGVETRAQADALLEQGCRIMQGYLYSPAIPADALTDLLHEDRQGGAKWGNGHKNAMT
ncbi:EAL domain-containing protein [Rhodospirillum sp. A1_3_36]|uniref:EAL domain-containing protein n=1 Tax=Rhodospirillum sp. A1_3_36 TaxID=3391666 RepID=UPI0039A6A605